ncbi:hypothetical protein NEIG_02433 [Nematocida sp. ERTm5]|nr:hypothetical protein NEIG_02433 [Nematocida sp. ERTm5]
MPKFHIKDKIMHTNFQYKGNPADLRMYNGEDPVLVTSEFRIIWKITNGHFIKQMHSMLKFVQNMVNAEESYGFKNYLQEYTHQYFSINDKPYFETVRDEIKDLERRVSIFYDTPDNEHGINQVNSMYEELRYIAVNTIDVLDIAIKNFITGLEKVEGYNTLTNKTNLPLKDSTEFKNAKHEIEQYVKYIQKIARGADAYIGLTKKEKSLNNKSYNKALVKKIIRHIERLENPSYNKALAENPLYNEISSEDLFDMSSYINKSSQVSFNPLLAISAAGTYILQNILFFR